MTASPAPYQPPHSGVVVSDDSRYDRQQRITWWNQAALASARVLVVGAGALGNEIVKSLALLGVGTVHVVDMDIIEHSNLARCVLFRDGDVGRAKADVVAERGIELNPDTSVVGHATTVQRLGAGAVHDADLVIAGLDNREARLWTGAMCRLFGRPWVDGAIEGLQGLARVFLPDGACYECSLGEVDRQILAHRRSCALLSAQEVDAGRTPTNATTASLVAAVEVQEAVKLLVGRDDLLALHNEAWVFVGETLDSYRIAYEEDEYCLSHDRAEDLRDLRGQPVRTLAEVCKAVFVDRDDAVVDLYDDLIADARCSACGPVAWVPRIRHALPPGSGECPECGNPLTLTATTSIEASDPIARVALEDLGMAENDLVAVRAGTQRVHALVANGPSQSGGTPWN